MGLFGPTQDERRLAAALAREQRAHQRHLESWASCCRQFISHDLIQGRPISLLAIHTPPDFDIDAEVAAERERLHNRNLLR